MAKKNWKTRSAGNLHSKWGAVFETGSSFVLVNFGESLLEVSSMGLVCIVSSWLALPVHLPEP